MHTLKAFVVASAMALAAVTAHAADYSTELTAFKGKSVKAYLYGGAGEMMTLTDVGTDYVKLRLTSPERNASVTYYVHFSAISDVRVNAWGTSSSVEIRVR